MEALQFVLQHWAGIIDAATALVTACSLIAALTPTPEDDSVVAKLRAIVNLLAMNWGHAKNRGQ